MTDATDPFADLTRRGQQLFAIGGRRRRPEHDGCEEGGGDTIGSRHADRDEHAHRDRRCSCARSGGRSCPDDREENPGEEDGEGVRRDHAGHGQGAREEGTCEDSSHEDGGAEGESDEGRGREEGGSVLPRPTGDAG